MNSTTTTDPIAGSAAQAHGNQFSLLGQRRFGPLFWTQFLGAGNDNLFKWSFTVMVTYQLSLSWLPASQAGLVIAALFILPFVLLSATSGQLADKMDKALLMRWIKNLEIAIMALGAWGFLMPNVPALLACTFLMGVHSTLFGPVKYAYLPQHLNEHEITGGNGMIEMGTFVAILMGDVVGGILISIPEIGREYVAIGCISVAVLGRVAAQFVPSSPSTDPGLKINWNPFSETVKNIKLARTDIVVFRSLLGISWMWFFGAVFLSQFPSFAKETLHGNEAVASLLLVVFSLGIGTGSLMCEMLSRRQVEIGLVPLGAIGMTVFAIDLYFASQGLGSPSALLSLQEFIDKPAHWRLMFDLFMLALSAGLYSVPMYALIQTRAPRSHCARIIAANNILNALFMIGASLMAGALLAGGISVPGVFLITGLLNAIVAGYIFLLVPEYLLRFIAFVLTRTVYRFHVKGAEQIPTKGAAVLVCNHVSFADAILLMAASPRPIRFVMDHRIFAQPVLGTLFRLGKAIPIAPQKEDAVRYEAAFVEVHKVLADDEIVAIFPEGAITRDGTLQPFKTGIMKILARDPVPVIPMALQNMWGSYFSRIDGPAMSKPLRRGVFSHVGLNVGAAIAPAVVTPQVLQDEVQRLLVA